MRIQNNISCNMLPNCSTPNSNRFAEESNPLNCNYKNAYFTVSEGSDIKITVPEVQNVPEHNVLDNMLTNCSMLNTDSHKGKKRENLNNEAINKPVKGVEMYILKQLEDVEKSVDSIMKCKYKNTTLENTLCVIKNKLINTKQIFMAIETSKDKQNGQKENIITIMMIYCNVKPLPHCQH